MQIVSRAVKTVWSVAQSISFRTLFALTWLALAFGIAFAPEAGAGAVLAAWGISPRGFAVVMGVVAGLVLRDERTQFGLFTLPYLIYCVAFAQYAQAELPQIAFTLDVIHFGLWALSQREGVEESGPG